MEKVQVTLTVDRNTIVSMADKLDGLGQGGTYDLEALIERWDYYDLLEDLVIQLGDQLRGV